MKEKTDSISHRALRSGLCLFLISILCVGPISQPAYADDSTPVHPAPIRPVGAFNPAIIGSVDSLAPILINGRKTQGREMIWRGDHLQLLADATARLVVNNIGEVVLSRGAIVRLSTSSNSLPDHERGVLIGSLIEGDMVVNLSQEGEAYIEAGESIITASGKASFRIRVQNDVEVVDAVNGIVNIQSRPKDKLKSAITDPVNPALQQISVKEGTNKPLKAAAARIKSGRGGRLLYTSSNSQSPDQTDAVEEPAPNILLRFEVDPGLGVVTPQSATTDQNGEIKLTFRPGSALTGKITARIVNYDREKEEIQEEGSLTINVIKLGFWQRNKKKIFIAAAAATAAAVGIILVTPPPPPLRPGPPRPVPK